VLSPGVTFSITAEPTITPVGRSQRIRELGEFESRRAGIEPFADAPRGARAVFDRLDPAQDQLGVGLADAYRTIGWTVLDLNAIVNQMPATAATYPDYKDEVKKLVQQHRTLRGERLHLAVYLALPKQPKRDVYLFEVIDDFGGGHIDPDKKLFTFAYGSTPGFPLPEGVSLWMILTNPTELDKAIQEGWKRVDELRDARRAGNAVVLYADAKGKKFWNMIK